MFFLTAGDIINEAQAHVSHLGIITIINVIGFWILDIFKAI